jgi:uncharacterized DUF497 family protein
MMNFDGDEEKVRPNFNKHDISFEEATSIFDDPLFLIFREYKNILHTPEKQRVHIQGIAVSILVYTPVIW